MKSKKGFTIIELLGVIVILGIIIGLASVAYINVRQNMKEAFYNTLKESIVVSGGEYFSYNEDNQPKVFGDTGKIELKYLVDNKYIEEIVDQKGKECDLEESYVEAYKNSTDKTKYYVCLKCSNDEYISEECSNEYSYALRMEAKLKEKKTIYNEGKWVNENIVLTFKTKNDVNEVELVERNGNKKTCNLVKKEGLKTCDIEVDKQGIYEYYGITNGNKTSKKEIKINIDKNKPTFEVKYEDKKIEEEVSIEDKGNVVKTRSEVINIKDEESGIKKIRYTFEKENAKENWKYIDIKETTFIIEKDLELGKYNLKIEITDNADNISERIIKYEVYRGINKPTSTYCKDIRYNGKTQTLTRGEGEGYKFINNTGRDAKSYSVTAKLLDNYRWEDGTKEDVTFTCEIKRLLEAEVGSCKNLTYNGSNQYLVNSEGSNVSYKNSEGKKAGSYQVNVIANSNYAFSDGTTSKTLNCSIGKKELVVTPNSQQKTYGGTEPTLTYTYTGNVSGESPKFSGSLSRNSGNDVGVYQITKGTLGLVDNAPFIASNYNLKFSTSVVYLTIKEKDINSINVSLSENSYTYDGTAKSPNVIVKDGNITLTSDSYTVSYTNNINAGEGQVKITGKGNYTGSKTLTFRINKRTITITATNQTITYGSSIKTGTTYITSSNLVSGHSISSVSLNQSTTNVTQNGTITPSGAKVVSGGTDVSNNYSITYKNGTLVIERQKTARVGSCKNLTYNGNSQYLVNSDGSNVSYKNSEGTNAGNYNVTVTSNSNYAFSDGTTSKTLNCSIAKKGLVVTATNQTITYGSSIKTGTGYITSSGLVSGHSVSSITLTQSTTNATQNGTITPSGAKVVSGETDVSNNYSITYKNGTLVINKAATATTGSCASLTYNGSSQTLASGGTNVSYSNNAGTNAGSYNVTVTSNSNYAFSDGTTSKTLNCLIAKKGLVVTAKDQSLDGITTITQGVAQITSSGLLNGHSISSITLTQSTTADTTNGTITPSGAKVVSGGTDVSNNYSITYKNGNLSITTKAYCMEFNKNGASAINGSSEESVSVCCKPGTASSCNITTPSITPITNYEVIGWNTSSESTTSKYNTNTTISLTKESDELFAITRSKSSTRVTNYVNFKLNGADSFTYNGTKYTNDTRISCQSDYGYNGEAIPDSCTITLPTIARSNGKVYGWSLDNNSYTSEYSVSSQFTVYDEITLNAITSKTIKLAVNGNGGTSTIGTLTSEAYNTETGTWFVLPSYDKKNMCRSAANYTNFSKGSFNATGYLIGYKYIGLTDQSTSKTVKYCPGNVIYLENDTTLYAVWNEDYATSKVTSGDSLNLRTGCSTSSSTTGSAMSGSTTLYIYQEGAKFSSGYMGYWLKYGSRSGCASSKYIQSIKYYPPENSCSREDYACNGGTAADLTLTPSVLTLNLKKNTSGTINIDNRCGNITSTKSNNTSLATVSRSGNVITVSAVSGSVAENQQNSTTVTVTTEFNCTESTEVIVKNTTATPPTVNISTTASTSCGTDCYKKGVKFTVTCSSSVLPITDFTVNNATITGDNYNKTAKITYSSTGKVTINASCTNSEGTTTTSKKISVKTYSQSSSCGVLSYSYSGSYTCYNSSGTVSDTYKCNKERYSYGSASAYCKAVGYQGRSTGSCKRKANYDSCWHS